MGTTSNDLSSVTTNISTIPNIAIADNISNDLPERKKTMGIRMKKTLFNGWQLMLCLILIVHLFPATHTKGTMTAEPEFVEPLQNLTVTAGRDVKLRCVVKHVGSYKVAWIHLQRSAILTVQSQVITRNPRVSVSHDGHRTWNLLITNVQESDRGGYMCQISTDPPKTRVGNLHVVVPPSIHDALSSSDASVREHGAVTLNCNATGSAPLTVRWRREDNLPININRTYSVNEWEGTHLTLARVTRLDMAAYFCIASNKVPPSVSKRIPLTVEFGPTVTVPHQLVGAPLGSSVAIDCLLESSPASLHFWSRADGVVLHDPAKYRVQSAPAVGVTTSASASYRYHLRLHIANVSASDYGTYRCVAKNPFGEADAVVKLYHTPAVTSTVAYTQQQQLQQQSSAPVAPFISRQRPDDVLLNDSKKDAPPKGTLRSIADTSGNAQNLEDTMVAASDDSDARSDAKSAKTPWTFSWQNSHSTAHSAHRRAIDTTLLAMLATVFLTRFVC